MKLIYLEWCDAVANPNWFEKDMAEHWIYMVNASLAMQLGIKDDFVENYETRLNEAYFHHMEFEGIHPFIDGNGRIGRMLLNWELRQMEMDAEVIYADKRSEYYAMFDRHRGLYDNTGNKTK